MFFKKLGDLAIAILLICLWAGSVSAQDFVIDLTYDDLGRVETIRHPRTGMVQSYTYNAAGDHVTLIVVPGTRPDTVAGIDCTLALRAEIRAPGSVACAYRRRESLAMRVGAG